MRSILLILLTVFTLSGVAADNIPTARTLELTASADMKVPPNIAYINIAVTTQAMTAKEAVTQNATRMQAVVDALQKAFGTTGKLQTGNYQVTPSYQYDDKTRKSSLTGYEATNQVRVQTTDLKNVGSLVDIASSAGSNQIQSLQFSRSDMDSITTQATLMAIQKAKADAAQMATMAGVTLGKIMTISTMNNGPGPLYKSERMMMAASPMDASTPVIPGEITVSGAVAVTYEIM